jgi:hypothetical protein
MNLESDYPRWHEFQPCCHSFQLCILGGLRVLVPEQYSRADCILVREALG